jgi:tRNA pseudouridine38-40 synthase
MRYALKFGYHGKNFSGYARQPGLRTVEGEIVKALKKTTMIVDEKDANFQTASRTDKGVSACGNVLAFDTNFRDDEIISALNANLEEIWFYGIKEVESSFNSRHAKLRWYRYYLFGEGVDLRSLEEYAKIFLGMHDFSNFARIEEGKNPARTIETIEITKENEFITLDFKAQSFLWQMIRRIVKAMMDAEKGKLSLDDLKNALEGKTGADFGIASAEPLILMDVRYDLDFNIDGIKLKNLKTTLEKSLHMLRINNIIYHNMLRILEG